ncbi:MAG: type II toxin-antitoxin system RelE/ParE family toxin [Ginsengibacter sp.]|jgi:plasmid stabilization system protein ParE
MTAYTYEILLKARKELLDAWEWYEDRQDGLGDRFINQVNEKIKQVIQTPKRYPERKRFFREAKIDIFPYLLIYKIATRKKVITIISVFHTSRSPKKKYIPRVNK